MEKKQHSWVVGIMAFIGVVAAIAAIVFAVLQFMNKDDADWDDFDDDFDDDFFDDDLDDDDEDIKDEVAEEPVAEKAVEEPAAAPAPEEVTE